VEKGGTGNHREALCRLPADENTRILEKNPKTKQVCAVLLNG
jgi:hypothetical protein